MTISRRALLFSFAATAAGLPGGALSATLTRRATAFGTIVSITATGASDSSVNIAIDACFASIRAVESAMNLFDPESEISRLNRTGTLTDPSQHFRKVLSISRNVHRMTGGAFDPTVQPLWNAWQTSLKTGRLPSASLLQGALLSTGFETFSLDDSSGRQLTFNGIAQGYACDLVEANLKNHGITEAIFDTGEPGRIGTNEKSNAIAIRHPRQRKRLIGTINISGGFLAVSGDYETAFTPDFSEHHIFDPATGKSPRELSCVCVLAKTGALADAYATAMMVMGRERSLKLVQAIPDLHVLMVDKQSQLSMSAGMIQRFSALS